MNGPALRRAIVEVCRQIHQRGWVANHDGNVTARLARDRYLATPTAESKRVITAETLITVNSAGKKVAGQRQIFSEVNLHMVVYQARSDVHAVLHAHPPVATARACSGLGLDEPFLPEAVVSIGPRVPLVPFALPGPSAAASLEPYLDEFDALLLQNHGVITWGKDPEMALLRMELVEHLCCIARDAIPYGGVRPLPATALPPLLRVRTRAGLGPEGRKAKQPRFMPIEDAKPASAALGALQKLTGLRQE